MADCVKDVGKYIVTEHLCPPVKRHFYYWWCFGDNIQGLKEEIRCLERERLKFEEARSRVESPTTEIENSLKDSTQKLEEAATGILQGCGDLKAWNIFSRYAVGKNAKTSAEGLEKLRKDGSSITIADPAPPPSMVSIYHEPTMEFESRRRIEEDIMECLNDNRVSMIAICGPGGVGKTTMVQRIVNRVRKDKLFNEVVMVVVSQQFEMLKIQKEVAELFGLKFSDDTLGARAVKLHTKLLDSKSKLIIFDDIWESFKLEKIGFPFGNRSTSCKIILTSRVKDACKKMKAQKIISLEVLTKEEAWTLFKEKAGSGVENPNLHPIAEAVAEECKGLPVALVTVGEALNDESIHVWRDSLSQLRRSIPIDFPEVIKDVYKPLKLSYDFLKNKSLESLFLLCCLFPEDYDISIELLTMYGIGLGIFEGIGNIEEGRSKTYSFVERLISRYLLMNVISRGSVDKHRVRMHDVVRDVAIFVGSKEKQGFLQCLKVSSMDSSSKDFSHNRNWMSIDISTENTKLSFGSDFPNLRLLMIWNSSPNGESSQVFDANFINFEGIEKLNVLFFSNMGSLPPTLEFIKELRTLHLYDCEVDDISIVGELSNLEILCIECCVNIEELPVNIRKLNRLRFLGLYNCKTLKRIVAGVISNLVGLEELKIRCHIKWEAKGNQSEERNACLSELQSLLNLTSLEIYIFDHNLVAQEINLSQKLSRYQICFGESHSPFDDMEEHERNISLHLPGEIRVGNWIRLLVRRTESLKLSGDGSNTFNLTETELLRRLKITSCSTVKKLVNAIGCKFLPLLEHLELRDLEELESIIDCTIPEGSNSSQTLEPLMAEYMPSLNQNGSLGNLISIYIENCKNLRYLFSVATVTRLVQLQHLVIEDCYTIEQLFWNEMESNTEASIIEFPKLQHMCLYNLRNLVSFSQGVEVMELPQLKKLEIVHCPKLRTKIGKCPNLRTIHFRAFNGLHHLLSSCCMRKWNIQLQELSINNNDAIEELLWDEIRDKEDRHIIFPALTKLELCDLPCLTTFYEGVESIKFPKLEYLKIGNLARMDSLLPMDSEATQDHHCLHFFCNQKVEIPSLKKLQLHRLRDTISNIWCRHIPANFFHNIAHLIVENVIGIRNLMSYSIAKNLVNLRHLNISRCQEMVVVIDDEKEVFVTSLFPNLQWLYIFDLPKLRSFCHCKNAFELPSLRYISVFVCPGMETFTLGSISAPNLLKFSIDDNVVTSKGLNDGIHYHYMTKMITRQEIEDEDEDKEEENEDDEENAEYEYFTEDEKEVEDRGKESSTSNFG